ncbi:MAG: hypothetical protein QM802_23140 [Agriterribacter sp.]
MQTRLPIFVAIVLLISCRKNESNTDKVFIRIENATTNNFVNFTLNTAQFGVIPTGDTSAYIRCENILPVPFANFIAINDTSSYIIDMEPTPYLMNGNYLMKVVNDTLPYKFRASFIKE